jgi:hypothetical protein
LTLAEAARIMREADAERVLAKIVEVPSGCWEWQGARQPEGYGRVRRYGETRQAHRVVYELLVGPIPDGLTLDHLANPLIDWTNEDCRLYAAEHEIPESPVAALLHKSGECNCGSFAAPGEREMLQALWPDWFENTIASLEREAEAAGIPACRWGERPGVPGFNPGALCTDCQLQFDEDA